MNAFLADFGFIERFFVVLRHAFNKMLNAFLVISRVVVFFRATEDDEQKEKTGNVGHVEQMSRHVEFPFWPISRQIFIERFVFVERF